MMISTKISGTLVKVKPVVVLVLATLWLIVSWLGWLLHPYRTLPQALLIGLVSALLMAIAEYGHPFAHLISARYAGAPMDELVISEGMPRTLYSDDSVPPNAHRLRALGGPIFNVLGVLLSVAVFVMSASNSLVREWASWSAFGHGMLLAESLFPVPMVDGGSLLKWTLVVRGMAPDQADVTIRRVDQGAMVAAAIAGVALLTAKMWLPGLACLGLSAVVLGVVRGKIR
jgi:hypothetical protein